MKDNQKNIVMIGVILLIVGSIAGITTLKEDDSELLDHELIECISDKSVLYVSKTCSHCARQKEILSSCLDEFEIVDCTSERERCKEDGITQVPTWVIDGKKYTGTKTIDELIEIHQTVCEVCK